MAKEAADIAALGVGILLNADLFAAIETSVPVSVLMTRTRPD
jgi:hypothetical protein